MNALKWVEKELPAPAPNSPSTGRLAQQANNWAKITLDPWVLQQIQDHALELINTPSQVSAPKETQLSQDLNKLLAEEIRTLLEKKAVSVVPPPAEGGFISRMFVIPKKGGGLRPIIDLRDLNKFIHWEHFKMEGIHLIKDLLQQGDWLVKIDLKDAYFAVPIKHSDHPLLRFQKAAVTYQFNCLPFGLSSAPRIFTKITRPITAWLRQLGCRMISYINDNLLMASSKQEALLMGQLAVTLLERLGFTINYQKSILEPTQSTQFLGFSLNTVEMTIRVPQTKMSKMTEEANKLLTVNQTTGRELASLIGTASSMMIAIPPAPLFYRALQAAKNSVLQTPMGLDTPIALHQALKEELQWWSEQAPLWNGCSLLPPEKLLKIQTDASRIRWGAHCQGRRTGGPWSLAEARNHINYLELLAIFLAIQTFASHLSNITIQIQTDNTSAMTYINRRVAHSPPT